MNERYIRVRTIKPTTRGRISIPIEFRRELGLDEGAQIEITLANGGITIRPFKGGEYPKSNPGAETSGLVADTDTV